MPARATQDKKPAEPGEQKPGKIAPGQPGHDKSGAPNDRAIALDLTNIYRAKGAFDEIAGSSGAAGIKWGIG